MFCVYSAMVYSGLLESRMKTDTMLYVVAVRSDFVSEKRQNRLVLHQSLLYTRSSLRSRQMERALMENDVLNACFKLESQTIIAIDFEDYLCDC